MIVSLFSFVCFVFSLEQYVVFFLVFPDGVLLCPLGWPPVCCLLPQPPEGYKCACQVHLAFPE